MPQPEEFTMIHPQPRRGAGFSLTPLSTSTDHSRSQTPSPSSSQEGFSPSMAQTAQSDISSASDRYAMYDSRGSKNPPPPSQRSRSILNLTSSTLLGIYSTTGYEPNRDEPSTPWGTGAQTPIRQGSFDAAAVRKAAEALAYPTKNGPTEQQKKRARSMSNQHARPVTRSRYTFGLFWRGVILFAMGMAYGEFVTHVHETQEITPIQVKGIDPQKWTYHVFWGLGAVALGSLLPLVDKWQAEMWEESAVGDESDADSTIEEKPTSVVSQVANSIGAEWNPIVRTIGAFVGIAFAIRKLPWQSTLQVSLTLTLVDPVIWYLIDRSKTGFALSSAIGISGAAALISINPDIVPSPAISHENVAGFTHESIGVATWIASVLFCSCVCFGNLGRMLTRADPDIL